MKINNQNNHYQKYLKAIQQDNQPKQATNKKANEQAPKSLSQDQVNISADAKRLAEIAAQEQRAARVDEIKAQVQEGTYEIKPQEIAKALTNRIQEQKGEN